MPARQLMIVLSGFSRWLGAADRLDFGVGKVFHRKRLSVPPLDAAILVYRIEH